MKIFEQFNAAGVCRICGTNRLGKAVLIPIRGSQKENLVACQQVHLDCLEPWYLEDVRGTDGTVSDLIVQQVPRILHSPAASVDDTSH